MRSKESRNIDREEGCRDRKEKWTVQQTVKAKQRLKDVVGRE